MIDVLETAELAADTYVSLRARLDSDGSVMPALQIPGRDDAYFALALNGDFLLMVRANDPTSRFEQKLDAIRISNGGLWELSEVEGQSSEEASFATVTLDERHLDLLSAFGAMSGLLLATLSARPTNAELLELVNSFLALFAPNLPVSRDTLVGLWGELWLISVANDRARLVRAWHVEPGGRFDFSLEDFRIEVKTTESASRTHTFALTQLEVQEKTTWIASVQVVADPSGMSILDLLSNLMDGLEDRTRGELVAKCLRVVAGDLEATSDFRFAPSGQRPLSLLRASEIPRVVVPVSSRITNVHFQEDISELADASAVTLEQLLTV